MTDYSYKKIITREENIENIKIWELVFFLFWDNLKENETKNVAKKSYKTECEIVEAIKSHYKDKAVTEKGKEKLNKLTQSGVSKGLKTLNTPVLYQGKTYIIQKSSISNKNLESKEYQINIFNIDIKEKMWEEEREKLLYADLLVKNQICPVSKYMYIFKIKPAIVRIKKKEKDNLTVEEYKELKKDLEKKQLRKNINSVKKYFRNMIDSEILFDVTSSGDKIMVMLNKTEDTALYVRLFDNFFKLN